MTNIDDQITASKNDSLLSQINSDTIESEIVAETPKEGVLNVFSKPENRWVIIGGGIVAVIVFGGLFIVASQLMAPKNVNLQRQGAADGTEIQQPVGDIPLPLQEEIGKKNEDIHKDNQFRHDLALEEGSKNQDKSDLLIDGFDSDEIEESKNGCKLDDTACFRIKKMIAPDECAPKDIVCQEAIAAKSGIQTPGPQNSKDIAEEKRIASPEYIKSMQDAFKEFAERKPVEIHWIAPAEEKNEIAQEDDNGTGIRDDKELGALESGEENIEIYQQSVDRLMAVADIALSSKIEGPVALTILGGKFLETKALGQAKRVDNYMRLEMTKWVLPDGRECKINAIALDPKTTYAAVSSRVDHHYLYRYGFWGLGTVLSAIGKAAQLNANKEVIVSDGVVIETEENDARREVKMAAGELGREIGEVMKKNIDYPSTVYVDVNEQMGFFFIDRVTNKDCK